MGLLGRERNKLLFFIILLIGISCSEQKPRNNGVKPIDLPLITVPEFNSDSAYAHITQQVSFGPRVPNSPAHQDCYNYLTKTLKRYGANTMTQSDVVKRYDGYNMEMKNIIASFNQDLNKRILLCAHWDTRFIADNDTINQDQPILGANDGASGVAVLLEIARQISLQSLDIGIDIVLFDVEDQGQPNNISSFVPHSWCLGSQYWASTPHVKNYYADFGILLDMVGGKSATFTQELTSKKFAPRILDNIWNTAHRNGFSNFFLFQETPPIIDDHLYINNIIHIPTVNIVEYNDNSHNHFNEHHHKHSDNMDIIDKKTLHAVGQTLLEVIYNTPK